jgi:hypothetical protein
MVPAAGGAFDLLVGSRPNCLWSAVSGAVWIQVIDGGHGSGDGHLTVGIQPNHSPKQRRGALTVDGTRVYVSQSGSECAPDLATTEIAVSSMGAAGIRVATHGTCPWEAASLVPWVVLTGGDNESGEGGIVVDVVANDLPIERIGVVKVGASTLAVRQAGRTVPGTECLPVVAPQGLNLASFEGTRVNVDVSVPSPECVWLARSNVSWLLTNEDEGVGDGSIEVIVEPNGQPEARSGVLAIGGVSFEVRQPGQPCLVVLEPSAFNLAPGRGGEQEISMDVVSSCDWSVDPGSVPSWISILGAADAYGDGMVTLSVMPNTGGDRTAAVRIGSSSLAVSQRACEGSLSISPAALLGVGSNGTPGRRVSVSASCDWAADSTVWWLKITSGLTGTGDGTVTFDVLPNTAPTTRSGTLTVAGQAFTVSQNAAPCASSLSPVSISAPRAGLPPTLKVLITSNCPWTATSSATWIQIVSATSGSGDGSITYGVTANGGTTIRQGTITIAGQTFLVTQAGK